MSDYLNVYTIDFKILMILKSKKMDLICYTCQKPIVFGDEVVAAKSRGKRKMRHKRCALRIGLYVEND